MTDERAQRMARKISEAVDSSPTPEIRAIRVMRVLLDEHNESIEILAKSLGALTTVLVAKGVVSHEDLDLARLQSMSQDQQSEARQLDEFLNELDADDPDIQDLIQKLRENGL